MEGSILTAGNECFVGAAAHPHAPRAYAGRDGDLSEARI